MEVPDSTRKQPLVHSFLDASPLSDSPIAVLFLFKQHNVDLSIVPYSKSNNKTKTVNFANTAVEIL